MEMMPRPAAIEPRPSAPVKLMPIRSASRGASLALGIRRNGMGRMVTAAALSHGTPSLSPTCPPFCASMGRDFPENFLKATT